MSNPAHITYGYVKSIVLVSLLIAATIFYFVMKPDSNQEALVRVPVEFVDLAGHLIISSASTGNIELLVKGRKETLENLKSPLCRLSLAQAQVGEKHIPVNAQSMVLPQGVHILDMEPVNVRVTIDKKISRSLPVEIVCTGAPAKGYRLVSAVAGPETIVVAGPQALIETIEKIKTKPVDVTGLSESCKKEAVYDIDPSWPMVLPQGPVVANLSIVEKTVVKKIDIPLTLPKTVTHVNPALASIEISGPENRFNGLDAFKDIEISIKADDLKPGVYVRRATISLPVDFTLISVKPELFTLTIK